MLFCRRARGSGLATALLRLWCGRHDGGVSGSSEVAEWVREAVRAAAAGDDDRRWELVTRLHLYGGADALDAARQLCTSPEAVRRVLGVDILAQVGAASGAELAGSPLHPEAGSWLLELAGTEQDPLVLAALGVAFSHRPDPRCLPVLVAWRTHADPDVRYGVAVGLSGMPEPAAYDVLIELSADPWRTSGTGRRSGWPARPTPTSLDCGTRSPPASPTLIRIPVPKPAADSPAALTPEPRRHSDQQPARAAPIGWSGGRSGRSTCGTGPGSCWAAGRSTTPTPNNARPRSSGGSRPT
jgi:hypothetical protein